MEGKEASAARHHPGRASWIWKDNLSPQVADCRLGVDKPGEPLQGKALHDVSTTVVLPSPHCTLSQQVHA